MFLVGDIGGTKTIFALAVRNKIRVEARFLNNKFSSFYDLLKHFLKEHPCKIEGICLSVAGPVKKGFVKVTNLPWTISDKKIQKLAKTRNVKILNDFEAIGYGVFALKPKDKAVLTRGKPERHGTIAVIGTGTGLGEAILAWTGERYVVVPSEGGHADFAPESEEDWELRNFITEELGGTDWESVVSGPGLIRIYNFLKKKAYGLESAAVIKEMKVKDPAAVISSHALKKDNRLCEVALSWFVRFLGAEAGNLALKAKATGGVYIAGGIAPKILPALRSPVFKQAFTNKIKMYNLLKQIPVFVVKNEKVGLLGALQVLLNK